jgi:CO/xanthine dehydrogenase FAD-binding subunit
MDLITVRETRVPTTRAEIALSAGEVPLGGGTWLFSEEQPGISGLVDLTGLRWPALTPSADGLSIAATCTIAELSRHDHPLFLQCADSLLASFKVWNVATVGGNICTSLPAGAMISLTASLDADALIWSPDGTDRRMPVADFIHGPRSNALRAGEVLRSIEIGRAQLEARTGFRRIALSPLGRAGTVVIARLGDDGFVLTITAGTPRPVQLWFPGLPSAAELRDAVESVGEWYDDAHGAPDWRKATSALFAEELRRELS